ncbi:putative tRNA(His) guanylyltransferase [Helianthus annuus]|nr:putative tRNA(His) guanylyltransferase [Helianthus annuus]
MLMHCVFRMSLALCCTLCVYLCDLHFFGTQAQEKNQMLSQLFGIDYNTLPVIFRNGSSVLLRVLYLQEMIVTDNGVVAKSHKKVFVEHPNIIEDDFWVAHPLILETTSPTVADLAR